MSKKILKFFDESKKKMMASGIFFLVLIIIPILLKTTGNTNESYIEGVVIQCMMWGAMTMTFDLLMGYMGIWCLAQQVFFGIAGYTSAMMNYYLGISPWLGFVFGPIAAALLGLLIAVPVLKLKAGPYVVIATMCLSEIVRLVFTNLVDWTRGELGFWQMDAFDNIFGINFDGVDKAPYYYLMFIIFAGIALVCGLLAKSHNGLAMKAVRDSQEAAESLGVNSTKMKIKIFVISSYMAGFVGVFYAHYSKILTPSYVFGQDLMTQFIAMDVLGGIATVRGPIFGSFFITIIMEVLQGIDDYRLIIYAVILIITTLLLPNGVLNSRTEFLSVNRKIRKKLAEMKERRNAEIKNKNKTNISASENAIKGD